MSLLQLLHNIPNGYSEVLYNDEKYGVTRTDFNKGKSIKLYAKELGGTNFISFNYYRTISKELIKPCEMPREKVIHFLKNYKIT